VVVLHRGSAGESDVPVQAEAFGVMEYMEAADGQVGTEAVDVQSHWPETHWFGLGS